MSTQIDYYPPLGFYYKVEFSVPGMAASRNDARFQTVSGLAVEYEYENYKEGGENRFEHKLPVRTKYADLILKRGMVQQSALIQWFLLAFRDRTFLPADLVIILLNEKSEPLKSWKVTRAIPKKWSVSDFNSMDSGIVIETLELTYQYFTVQ